MQLCEKAGETIVLRLGDTLVGYKMIEFLVTSSSELYNNAQYFLEINKMNAILMFLFPTSLFKWNLLILWDLTVSFLVFWTVLAVSGHFKFTFK